MALFYIHLKLFLPVELQILNLSFLFLLFLLVPKKESRYLSSIAMEVI